MYNISRKDYYCLLNSLMLLTKSSNIVPHSPLPMLFILTTYKL